MLGLRQTAFDIIRGSLVGKDLLDLIGKVFPAIDRALADMAHQATVVTGVSDAAFVYA